MVESRKVNFEDRVSSKWGWFKLKSKSKKFLTAKQKYIKRYKLKEYNILSRLKKFRLKKGGHNAPPFFI